MRTSLARVLGSAAVALTLAGPLTLAVATLPSVAAAQEALPAPYLSHALDALLLPVDDSVRAAFGLLPEEAGVLVLAIAPGGLADSAGLIPGDVLSHVQGEAILTPADLDGLIWAWLQQGLTGFTFDGARAGTVLATDVVITLEAWEETVEIAEISTWTSVEDFAYAEYSAEYSEEISASYAEESFEATSETLSDETVVEDEAAVDEGSADDAGDAGGDEGGGDEVVEE
jgi:hypothetical protein